jgi:hypothetical protein
MNTNQGGFGYDLCNGAFLVIVLFISKQHREFIPVRYKLCQSEGLIINDGVDLPLHFHLQF